MNWLRGQDLNLTGKGVSRPLCQVFKYDERQTTILTLAMRVAPSDRHLWMAALTAWRLSRFQP